MWRRRSISGWVDLDLSVRPVQGMTRAARTLGRVESPDSAAGHGAVSGAENGGMHLVEWDVAAESVRAGAQVFDLCPKNLDIYVDDLPVRMAQLAEQGVVFRNEHFSEAVSPDGVHFREIHLAGHDDINIVLLQVIGSDTPIPKQVFMVWVHWYVLCVIPRQRNILLIDMSSPFLITIYSKAPRLRK